MVALAALASTGAGACTLSLDYLKAGGTSTDGGTGEDTGVVAHPDGSLGEDAGDAGATEDGTTLADAADDVVVNHGNLIVNPGFEEAVLAPWVGFGGATIATSTAQAHTGSHSVLTYSRTQPYHAPMQDISLVVSQGHSYAGSAWVLISGGAGANDGGAVSDGGPDAPSGASEAGPESGVDAAVDARSDAASAAGSDAASDAGTASGSDSGALSGITVKVSVKSTCPGVQDTYTTVGSVTTANSSTWSNVTGTFVVPACPLGATNNIYIETAVGNDYYVDDVSLVFVQ